jgi:hypothetical protein
MDENSIYQNSGTWESGTFMCTGSSGYYTIGGSGYLNNWVFGAGQKFGVTKTGAVWCSDIHSTGGTVGGWHISEHGLSSGRWQSETNITETDDIIAVSSDMLQHVYFDASDSATTYLNAEWDWVIKSAQDWNSTNSYESDVNVKNSIMTLDTSYDNLFNNLKPCKYKYNHGTSDRYHTGFIAQEVVDAIENSGLTTQDFAGVVHLDEPNRNGCEWLLRRDEFVALNTWQIQKLKQRVAELESRLGI